MRSFVGRLRFHGKFLLIGALSTLAVSIALSMLFWDRLQIIFQTQAQINALAGVRHTQDYLLALQDHRRVLLSAAAGDNKAVSDLPEQQKRLASVLSGLAGAHNGLIPDAKLELAWQPVLHNAAEISGLQPEQLAGRKLRADAEGTQC